jgi:regulator of RNase E activity RraA
MRRDAEYLDGLGRELYVAVLADVLDAAGRRAQVMRHDIRPQAGGATVVGRAYPMLAGDQVEVDGDPYRMQIEATDALSPGDVVVAAANGPSGCAFWGELFSTAARARGARGAVIDGLVRDTRKIDEMAFPVFASGIRPIDSMRRLTVYSHGEPIRCGDVVVRPGDLVFAESDGIAVVPAEIEEEVVSAAREKVSREDGMRADIEAGMLLADAWKIHRVL